MWVRCFRLGLVDALRFVFLYGYLSYCEGPCACMVPKALTIRGLLAGRCGLPHGWAPERPASSGVRSLKDVICHSSDEPTFTSIRMCVQQL